MAQTVSIILGGEDRKRLEAIASDRSRVVFIVIFHNICDFKFDFTSSI